MGEGVNCWQLEVRGAKALNSAISMDSSSFRGCVSNIFDNDDCWICVSSSFDDIPTWKPLKHLLKHTQIKIVHRISFA